MPATTIGAYRHHVAERSAVGLPPLPLSAEQTAAMVQALLQGDGTALMQEEYLQAIAHRVLPGVDEAARVKAELLKRVAAGDVSVPGLDATQACAWLGSMVGGYAVQALVQLLDEPAVASHAAKALGLALHLRQLRRRRHPRGPGPRRGNRRHARLGRSRVVPVEASRPGDHRAGDLQGRESG